MDPKPESPIVVVTKRFRVELSLPDDVDPSALLESVQALAREYAENFNDNCDDDDYGPRLDLEAIENAVSVQVLP